MAEIVAKVVAVDNASDELVDFAVVVVTDVIDLVIICVLLKLDGFFELFGLDGLVSGCWRPFAGGC